MIARLSFRNIACFASVFVAFIVAFSGFGVPKVNALSGSEFNAGRIIDDVVFYNASSMSPTQIQNFLNAKLPTCDTNGQKMYNSSQTRAQWASANGKPAPPYTCLKDYSQNIPTVTNGGSDLCKNSISGGLKSSAQIIYDVAQACGINPQVILVLLQKEQSLVTDDWPWPVQYRSATGYGCPDTAPCDAEFYGFFNQVYQAAKAFRRYEANPTSYNYRANRNNAIQYNPNAGCGNSNVFIQNQATASLYIYTPYQPNPAALNNLYGTGDSCSAYGNRNFWRMFNDWFGSTLAPAYGAIPYGQSVNPTVIQGQSAPVYMRFKNVGSTPWYDEITAYQNYTLPVRLGTDNTINRPSVFAKNWNHPTRPARTFGRVYNQDWSLPSEQHIVYPGQVAEFWFDFNSSLIENTGQYLEAFRPVVEGYGPVQMVDTAFFNVALQNINYSAEYKGQSAFPTVLQGQSANAYFKYKNTGNVAWYDATSSPGSGQQPVRLATDQALNRSSIFGSNWPLGATRPSINFTAIYESDGTTLAANQHIAQPGQIVQFDFNVKSHITQATGFYPEAFRPIVEGYGPMNNTGTWLGVTVQPVNYTAQYSSQSGFPAINRGSSSTVFISYKNTGNIAWYDNVSAWSNNQLPVRLATDFALNRSSAFGGAWPFGSTRPAIVFSAVYEANGVTLAGNQNVVQPGQIGRFSFPINVPVTQPVGFYPEAFRPIVEGYGPMNNTGTWLGVTVQ